MADIERAIELGTDDAVLLRRERAALRSLVELSEIRVAELMRPRSKLATCLPEPDLSVLASGVPPSGYVMVTDATGHEIIAAIGVRMLRPSQLDDLSSAAEPVLYVPWSARVSQVLDQLNDEARSVAVVVNELGEAVGAVTIDDILRTVLAAAQGSVDTSMRQSVAPSLGDETFRVAGSTSLRSLAKRLAIEVPDETIITVGGFLQKQNERLPRLGDIGRLDQFVLEVVDDDEEGIWIDVRPHGEDGPADEVRA